ncbi:glycosyltransferase-like domain-containing protein 1-like protein [Leptotrombidium deliense]|uniref:tRNA-queuosine alpha-mannosyltransferase n=1 Tax=Leptotrombidium deliense TaxID=299467 RepID=A0A443SH10_9ACAR|nr:glycosyltransferase-like domain-containing protein 1-like protein [Leptotrombidium deliense]
MNKKVLIVEPFYTGSHRGLIDALMANLGTNALVYTMKGIKWPWRSRTSALHFSENIPKPIPDSVETLFASSVLNLAELCALRTDIAKLRKVIYFHENQLIYPRQQQKERDFQYGYNQILSCLVADLILFNSEFNRTSFLSSIKQFLKLMPDYRPKHLADKITPKEHDKDPQTFFNVLFKLKEEGISFKVSVLGENYAECPLVFEEAKKKLSNEIMNWGFVDSKEQYWNILESAHVVVSTAKHEFYGVAMLEAAYKGCFPLCPNSLVYPEIYPSKSNQVKYKKCLYDTEYKLYLTLKMFALNPDAIEPLEMDLNKYSSDSLLNKYRNILLNDS